MTTMRGNECDINSLNDSEYMKIHCISADLYMGNQISRFLDTKYDIQKQLNEQWKSIGTPVIGMIGVTGPILNVVMKYSKSESLKAQSIDLCFSALRSYCLRNKITKIAISLANVIDISTFPPAFFDKVIEVFGKSDIEILVCS